MGQMCERNTSQNIKSDLLTANLEINVNENVNMKAKSGNINPYTDVKTTQDQECK